MGLNALKINSCVPILVMCWFEEKIDARADNPQKNRTFEGKTALCGQTGIDCVGSRLVCDHAPENAGVSVKYVVARRLKAVIPPLKPIEGLKKGPASALQTP